MDSASPAWRHHQVGAYMRHRQAVVAIDPGQLLQQICLDGDIKAPAGHRAGPALVRGSHAQPEAGQNALDLRGLHAETQQFLDTRRPQTYIRRVRQMSLHTTSDRARLTADDIQQQLAGALHGLHLQLEIHAPLEAVRRVGMQTVGTGLTRQQLRGKESRFQKNIGSASATAVACPPIMPAMATGPL